MDVEKGPKPGYHLSEVCMRAERAGVVEVDELCDAVHDALVAVGVMLDE